MRVRAVLLRAGAVATAVVLLTACGGSDDEPEASSGSSGTTSGPGSTATTGPTASATDEVAEFCTEADALQTALAGQLADAATDDPTTVPAVLQGAVAQYEAIDPPAELEQDWQLLSDSARELAGLAQGVDFSRPGALEQFAASLAEEDEAATTANTSVEGYLAANCAAG